MLVWSILVPCTSPAAPADPGVTRIRQPDGVRVRVRQRGDEWRNRVETEDGYTVAKDDDGYWYYVSRFEGRNRILSATRADQSPPEVVPRHVRGPKDDTAETKPRTADRPSLGPSGAFSGTILFILAEFTDQSGTYAETEWETYSETLIHDYFNTASNGNVSLSPARESYGTADNGIVGWVSLGYAHPDTGADTGTENRTLSSDAITAADPYIDYSAYDTDGDGWVDADELAIVVVVAGYEAAYSSDYSPSVWGHKWSVSSPPTLDGVIVGGYHIGAGGYAQIGEIHRRTDDDAHQATLGIMVHELGHLIYDLPDLYDTDGSSSGIGIWGIMGEGVWGQAGDDTWAGETPVLPTAWTRYTCGWADGTEGSGSQSVTGAGETDATAANTLVLAATDDEQEYFLVENRQPSGYDKGLERWLGEDFGGLAIWHIDEGQTDNTDDDNRLVDLEEADATLMGEDSGEATDLWFQGNADTFNDTSDPDSRLYDGSSTDVSVTSISASAAVMTAFFGEAAASVTPVILAGLGTYTASGGRIEVFASDITHQEWIQGDWAGYNTANGETRIATGDIDGDGKDEIIVGFGPVPDSETIPGGWFRVLDDDYTHLAWGQVDWSRYNEENGETWPATGDFDGDGIDEIVIGLGAVDDARPLGWFEIFTYDAGTVSHNGWAQVDWSGYNRDNGATRPACGDIDGDGKDEIVVGLGPVSGNTDRPGGWFRVFDDDYTVLEWGQVNWSDYNEANGETWPAIQLK